MREAVFITEIVDSLKVAGCLFVYKPADSPMSWTQHQTRFTLPKPCDIITCDREKMILIECKQLKKYEAFGERHMRPSQIENLTNAHKMGHKAFVFLNIRLAEPRRNILLIFNWAKLVQLWADNKGSIKGKDIEARANSESAFMAQNGIFPDIDRILDM